MYTKEELAKMEVEPDWRAKKMPEYCRPHGERIIVFLGGIGGCRKCCDKLIKEFQEKDLTSSRV
jgi:hypothetical protein